MSFEEELKNVEPMKISTFSIELIATGRKEKIINYFPELFLKCHSMFRGSFLKNVIKIEGIEETLLENFELIINNIADREVANTIKLFSKFDLLKGKIVDNFSMIMEKCRNDYLMNLIKDFKEDAQIMEQVNNNIDIFKERIDADSVVEFIEYMKETGKEMDIVRNFDYWYDKSNKKHMLQFASVVTSIEGTKENIRRYCSDMIAKCINKDVYDLLDKTNSRK